MSNELQNVQAGYDRWAAVYDHDANPLQALETPIVRAALNDVKNKKALDLGCGTGRHSLWLAERGAIVTAIDFSQQMLEEAKMKPFAEKVNFLTHDLHHPLPFTGEEFDIAVSGLVLEHLKNLDAFFAETRRVLKSDGKAIISAMHPMMHLRGTQAQFTDPRTSEKVRPGSLAHSISAFVMAAIKAGFTLKNVQEYSPDADFAKQFARAEKHTGWPMLVVMQLKK